MVLVFTYIHTLCMRAAKALLSTSELEVLMLVLVFTYIHTLCMRAAKALPSTSELEV